MKEKLEPIEKLLVFAIVFFVLIATATTCNAQSAYSYRLGIAETETVDLYGEWISMDGEHTLYLNYTDDGDTFYRVSPTGSVYGEFKVSDQYFLVTKEKESYKLLFYLKGINLIVMKPKSETSEGDAWLFSKRSNIQYEY
tara:strand:+ start:235 stop:654 length:420 start_codon:yes stop_codon:yes gene_type:complete